MHDAFPVNELDELIGELVTHAEQTDYFYAADPDRGDTIGLYNAIRDRLVGMGIKLAPRGETTKEFMAKVREVIPGAELGADVSTGEVIIKTGLKQLGFPELGPGQEPRVVPFDS